MGPDPFGQTRTVGSTVYVDLRKLLNYSMTLTRSTLKGTDGKDSFCRLSSTPETEAQLYSLISVQSGALFVFLGDLSLTKLFIAVYFNTVVVRE